MLDLRVLPRRAHWPTFGFHATTASVDLRVPPDDRTVLFARPSGSAPMAEYLRQRNPSFSVHLMLDWTIVKTRYASVQYVLLPRTLTT